MRTALGSTITATVIGVIFLVRYLAFDYFPRADAPANLAACYRAFRDKTCPTIFFTE